MWGQLHRICKKFVTLHRKFDEMTRREINIVKREQKMAETFGRYNIFATLSFSVCITSTVCFALLIFSLVTANCSSIITSV